MEDSETRIIDEEEEICELGEFLEDADKKVGKEGGTRAVEEGSGDNNSISKVAEEVTGNDGENEGFVEECFGWEWA